MRGFLVGIAAASILLASANDVSAQRAFSNQELNQRISALRSRLQNYQLKTVRKVVDRTPADNETVLITTEDTIEKKSDKPFVEIDTRPDAAVTVLFHDNEFAPVSAAPVQKNAVKAQADFEEEKRQRQEKFAALRLKVQSATRRTHDQARKITDQVARLP